jgi:hypothetical protein
LNGFLILITSAAQASLGLYILYPFYDSNRQGTIAVWVIYGLLVGGWVIAFAVTEVWFRLKNSRGSSTFSSCKKTGEKGGRIPDSRQAEMHDFHAVKGTEEKTRFYSWDEVDSLVGEGQILVIGNGRYVYDASHWIASHPGGKMILKTVAGMILASFNQN